METKTEPVVLNGKRIGSIITDDRGKTYRTQRRASIHFFRMHDGYAISFNVLKLLKSMGIERIEIELVEQNHEIQPTKLEWWFKHGKNVQAEGYGLQVVLPEKTRSWLIYNMYMQPLTNWC
jgi:hypothetical protein